MAETLGDLALQQLREELLARLWAMHTISPTTVTAARPESMQRVDAAADRWWRTLCDPAPTTLCDVRDVAAHYPSGFFDGIWASASLFHLPTADMHDVLGQLGALLRPGGKLFVSVRSSGETGWLDEPDGRRWYRVWAADALADAVTAAAFTVDELTPGRYTELWATRDQHI